MTVFSKMKKETGNLAYLDKNNYSFQYQNKNTYLKFTKKASYRNTPIGLGLFKVNNKNTKRKFESMMTSS